MTFLMIYSRSLYAYIAEQVLQVAVGGVLPLVLGQFLYMAVQAKVEACKLLLHLPHMLKLLEGAHLS